jgi:hypothetical protein
MASFRGATSHMTINDRDRFNHWIKKEIQSTLVKINEQNEKWMGPGWFHRAEVLGTSREGVTMDPGSLTLTVWSR